MGRFDAESSYQQSIEFLSQQARQQGSTIKDVAQAQFRQAVALVIAAMIFERGSREDDSESAIQAARYMIASIAVLLVHSGYTPHTINRWLMLGMSEGIKATKRQATPVATQD